ncbi:MAG TPA: hypothetical protein VM733_04330 [Thermoanaerobaculia bacterium]|nr:hypothetical protein [Thermoanaerobaculia bacterium]
MILAAALLEVLSVLPSKEIVHTDETFSFTVRVRNVGPDAAEEVKLRAGANASGLIRSIQGPPAWKCDDTNPRFATVTTCTAATLPAKAEATFTVLLTAPQPSAMTYRIGAAVSAKGIRSKAHETNMTLRGSASQSELSMVARKIDDERAAFDVRNGGPKDAKDVWVVIENAALASGDGWKCEASSHGVVCRRGAMRAKTTSTIEARGGASTKMEAQVRAELNLEEQPRDNAARP